MRVFCPLLLGAAFALGLHGISADNKKPIPPIPLEKKASTESSLDLIDKLKPQSAERKHQLERLQEQIGGESDPKKIGVIAERLISNLDRNQDPENWAELIPVIVFTLKGQGRVFNQPEDFRFMGNPPPAKELKDLFSKVLLSPFNPEKGKDQKDLSKLQKEAENGVILLADSFWSGREVFVQMVDKRLGALTVLSPERLNEVSKKLEELLTLYIEQDDLFSNTWQEIANVSAPHLVELI